MYAIVKIRRLLTIAKGCVVPSVPGEYKQSLRGHSVFIPDALPPQLDISVETERLIEDATHLLGQVEMCRTLLPNADLLIYSSLRREALASSTIEGTIASADELVRYQALQHSEREAVREVANYGYALEWGVEQLASRPIGTVLLLGLHERLLSRVRGESQAGRFKEQQNYIGTHPEEVIEDAVFVPPPPENINNLVRDLEGYINLGNREAKVVQCALAHYQFETIHPFHDGNGRVGRLLIILQLIQLSLLSAPLIYPSVYFERHREEYYQRLQMVRDAGDWNGWISFFGRGIKEQCSETINFTHVILELRQRMRDDVSGITRRAAVNEVLDCLFVEPVLTVRQIVEKSSMAHNTAQTALNELIKRGIVYEVTGRQKGRSYACGPVLQAIFGGMKSTESDSTKQSAESETPQ